MTARRLRAFRPEPHKPPAPEPPKFVLAPGHYDGDGCTFPARGHLIPAKADR